MGIVVGGGGRGLGEVVGGQFCMKRNLKDLSRAEMEEEAVRRGQPRYRGRQLAEWVFRKDAASFDAMTNLPADFRAGLAADYSPGRLKQLKRLAAADSSTIKYLFGLPDGEAVETVLMVHDYGTSACVSTQVGCRMGCSFCASTLGGLVRNLSAGEIFDQVPGIRRDTGRDVQRVVIMGAGEPLDNFENTMRFIETVTADYGPEISRRRITLSTCGLVPQIKKLADRVPGITLAVSLHAPDNELRNQIMPVNRRYPLEQLMPACEEYAARTGRRVTFEYALLAGVNDAPVQATQLAALVRGVLGHINLIPVNVVPERGYTPPTGKAVARFKQILERNGISVTVRREMGADIEAACGQLRRRYRKGE